MICLHRVFCQRCLVRSMKTLLSFDSQTGPRHGDGGEHGSPRESEQHGTFEQRGRHVLSQSIPFTAKVSTNQVHLLNEKNVTLRISFLLTWDFLSPPLPSVPFQTRWLQSAVSQHAIWNASIRDVPSATGENEM